MKTKIKRIFLFIIFLPCLIYGQEFFDELTSKNWIGTGNLMGTQATFEMQWSWKLDNHFVHLEFKNERIGQNNKHYVFKAHAYYKVKNDTLIEGMWFDSRGIYFPLTGTLKDKELIINWGTPETEQGRTVYNLNATNKISVTDYILKNGEYVQFGSALYK